jgi:hypothetical protein
MVRADFLERTRRYSFLVTLASALYLAYAVATEKVWIVVGNGYRGVYNSAWIGALMAICCSTFLSLVGFYIVKNSVQRDVDTRVGQILAATPMRKDFYMLAKTLSNFAVLACMVFVLMLTAVVMQRLLAEPNSFSLWKLWAPFLFLALPTMLITSSIAVLFEAMPVLRGGVGNVIYFFLWTAWAALGVNGVDDPIGLHLMYSGTRNTLRAIDPKVQEQFAFSLTIGGARAVRTFQWNGIEWTGRILLWRLIWIGAAVAIAVLASFFFHRFDPARSSFRRRAALAGALQPDVGVAVPAMSSVGIHLTALRASRASNRFGQLVTSELRLMLKGQRWWWYAVAAGLLIGQLVSPDPMVRGGFLITAWIWPILLWSQMGCREARHNTSALLFSCEHSLTRQLPAVLGAGVLVSLLTGAGVGIRLVFAVDWHGFAAWLAGAVFIPSLAFALGTWTGNSKTFEALYTVWWYVGPAHQIPGVDFMGIGPASSTPGVYAIAAVLLVMAAYWRRRQSLGYA